MPTHAPLINGLNVMPAFYTSLAALFTYWPALDTFWATSLTLPTILPTLGFASDIKPRAIVPPASSALPNPLYKNPRTVLTPFVNLCVRKFIPLIVILYNIIKKSGGKKIFFEFYLSITFNKYGLYVFLWFRPHTTDNYFILQYIFCSCGELPVQKTALHYLLATWITFSNKTQ